MKISIRRITALLSATLLAGAIALACGSEAINKENYDKVQKGMNLQQVQKILGEPMTSAEADLPGIGPTELLHFQKGLTSIDIWFRDGRVVAKNWTKL